MCRHEHRCADAWPRPSDHSGRIRAGLASLWLVSIAGLSAADLQGQTLAPAGSTYEVTMAAGCAPMLTYGAPQTSLHLISTLDPSKRLLYGPGDTLVVKGGSTEGVQAGQEYFVRRLPQRFGMRRPDRDHPATVHTAGWIRIIGVDETLSTATVVHACDGMVTGDYLEPFSMPAVPSVAAGQPAYDDLATVLGGDEDRNIVGRAEFVIVDRGSDHGVAPGVSFVILRDTRSPGAPYVEVGEGIVLMTTPQSSTAEIIRTRDAIQVGDFVAFRK